MTAEPMPTPDSAAPGGTMPHGPHPDGATSNPAPSEAIAADAVAVEALGSGAPEQPKATTDAGSTPEASAADGAVAPAAGAAGAAAAATPVAPAVPARRARTMLFATGRRLLRLTFAAVLLAAGAYAGWQFYLSNQPVAVIQGDPAVVGVPTPAVVAELATAIANDDSDAIRAALAPEIFSSYTADLQSFGITQVVGVDTLGTYADGTRTATELVLHGRDATRNPFSMNLVVLTEGGVIVRLR